jgi:hypothetical protein
VDMKERILLIGTEYSVLKEKIKEHECGWSNGADPRCQSNGTYTYSSITKNSNK